jgi:hypothetical protein
MRRLIVSLTVVGSLSALGLAPASRPQAEGHDNHIFTTIDPPRTVCREGIDINPAGGIMVRYYAGSVWAQGCGAIDSHNLESLSSSDQFTTIDFPGAATTTARDINASGSIVGNYTDAHGATHGWLLSEGEFTTIDVPGAVSTLAFGINPGGDIVGFYKTVLRADAKITSQRW